MPLGIPPRKSPNWLRRWGVTASHARSISMQMMAADRHPLRGSRTRNSTNLYNDSMKLDAPTTDNAATTEPTAVLGGGLVVAAVPLPGDHSRGRNGRGVVATQVG